MYISLQDVNDTIKSNNKLKRTAALTQFIGLVYSDILDHICRNNVLVVPYFSIPTIKIGTSQAFIRYKII